MIINLNIVFSYENYNTIIVAGSEVQVVIRSK